VTLGAARSPIVARRVARWRDEVDEAAAGIVRGGQGRTERDLRRYARAAAVSSLLLLLALVAALVT